MADFIPLTLDELPGLLAFLPSDDRDTWWRSGMAIKAEFGESGFAPWDDWSSEADNYKARDAQASWRSFKGDQIKMGTLIELARQAGWTRTLPELSEADKKRLKEEQAARRTAHQAAVEADEQRRRRMQQAVSNACTRLIEQYCKPATVTPYLERKGVAAFGVYEPRFAVLLASDDQRETAELWAGSQVQDFYRALPKPRPDHISWSDFKPGTLVIPLRDQAGQVWCVQFILPNGTKLFPRYSRKSGCFHVLGQLEEAPIVALAEGYATAATVHMATGWPCAMSVDSGNLLAVATALRALCPDAELVIAADDDAHRSENPGLTAAHAAAAQVRARVVAPVFAGEPA